MVVEVYADADEVVPLLDGVEQARSNVGETHPMRAMLETTYRPGSLTAIAYRDGTEICRTTMTTAGDPRLSDQIEPGAGEDADGVRVVVFACSGLLIEVLRPGVGSSRVAREVADGVAKLFVARPAESDGSGLAGLSGGRRDAGEAGQGLRSRETCSAVTDLAEQSGRAHGSGSTRGMR